ncbi:carboxymuconolactone decarboxylase family protein [Roseivivax sp. CAU 1753]
MADSTRLAPVTDADWPADIAAMRDGFAGGLNVYRTMAHHPALLAAWSGLRAHIVQDPALGRVLNEVVILRTGYRLGSDYEWHQHIERARALGLSDARIASIRGPKDAMSEEDRLLCTAVDDLFDAARLTDATRRALMTTYGKEATLDLLATVGFYSVLGFILNSFETPLDADIRARLDAAPLAP